MTSGIHVLLLSPFSRLAEFSIMYRIPFVIGLASCQFQIPYNVDEAQRAGVVLGTFGGVPDVNERVPIRLTFTNAVDVIMQTYDGLGFSTEVSGSVSLGSDSGEVVDVELDLITIVGEGDGPFESSELGIGPGSELLENFNRIDIIPTSDQGGVLRLGHEEPLPCLSNSSITVPWLLGEFNSYLGGGIYLIDSNSSEVISSSIHGSNIAARPHNRISLHNGDLGLPDSFNEYIRSLIPHVSEDSSFENCDQIRTLLPQLLVQFEPNGSQILFYPEDYTVDIPGTSSCYLRVNAQIDLVDVLISINPFLLKDVGVSVNSSSVTFCDLATH